MTLHKQYPELLQTLNVAPLRIVTNGWWIKSPTHRDRFVDVIRSLKNVTVGVSRDRFHPAGIGEAAYAYLQEQRIADDWGLTATKDSAEEERAIVPVGRAYWNELGDPFLRMFGAYCRTRKTRQSLCVVEDGTVMYCPFGIWPIGSIEEGFEALEAQRLEMARAWVPSCVACYRTWLRFKKSEAEAASSTGDRAPA